jgi:hypothetical protein
LDKPERTEWYDSLVGDCKAIITEAVFTSRWSLVEGYHRLGERIATDDNFQKYAKGNNSCFAGLRNNIGISESTLYRAVQFYALYPDLSLLPEGKDITWNKIVTKYLPAPQEEPKQIEPTYLSPEQQTAEFAVAMICGAIDDHDKEWLLSKECFDCYFKAFDLPYDPIKDWVDKGFLTIEELLKEILYNRLKEHQEEGVEQFLPDEDMR